MYTARSRSKIATEKIDLPRYRGAAYIRADDNCDQTWSLRVVLPERGECTWPFPSREAITPEVIKTRVSELVDALVTAAVNAEAA